MSTELVSIIIAAAGIIIAAAGAVLGWFFGTRTERATNKQYQLDARSFAASWETDLRAWAFEAINVLSEASERCTGGGSRDKSEALLACRSRLSALIDQGRFFFPNSYHEEVGLHKPEAYRGYRHPILDYLVGACRIIGSEEAIESFGFDDRKSALISLKRSFVSDVQIALKPRLQIREINRLIETSRVETPAKDSPVSKYLLDRIRQKAHSQKRNG